MLWCWWAPDSRHLLTMADFSLQISLWSLVSKSISFIKYPKLPQSGLDFTRSGSYMALAERRDCKDMISIFDCSSWQLVQHFAVDTTDLAGIAWSPDGRVLAVWDSVLDYKVLLYSMDGSCLGSYSAYEHALGVKTVSWAPSSQFLAIGSFDEKVRVLNHLTWRAVAEHRHPNTVDCPGAAVYTEVEVKLPASTVRNLSPPNLAALSPKKLTALTNQLFPQQSRYETVSMPVTVPGMRPEPEKPNPQLGVGVAMFSSDCRYLATRNDNMGLAVWVWDMQRLSLAALLLHSQPVEALQWDPLQPRLAIATGNSRLYLWSPAGCVSVCIPAPADASFSLQQLAWHPDGTQLALVGASLFTVCLLRDQEGLPC